MVSVTWHPDGVPNAVEALRALPQGTFFHTPRWFRVLGRVHPQWRAAAFVARATADSEFSGDVRGALSFIEARRWGLRRVYAGPWGTYGGAVARDEDAARSVCEALRDFVASRRVVVARVHDFSAASVPWLESAPHWQRVEERCQVLDLVEDPQALFRDAFTSQNRNKIRKAEKRGLTVRLAHDEEALQAYARLYAESASRWNTARALPATMFAALAEAGPDVQIWLAERDGEPVAALLNLRGGGQIMNWGNVSLREAWRDAPNNLLHWRAVEAACLDADGPRLYNFGSSVGLPGVETFKASFGAREHVYARLEYVAPWAAWLRRLRGPRAAQSGSQR